MGGVDVDEFGAARRESRVDAVRIVCGAVAVVDGVGKEGPLFVHGFGRKWLLWKDGRAMRDAAMPCVGRGACDLLWRHVGNGINGQKEEVRCDSVLLRK